MDRDKRWIMVDATVRDYIWPYEDEQVVPTYPVVEFLIEVRYNDKVWYSRILVAEDELRAFPNLYGLTLDKMVENIDDRMRDGDV